MKSISRLIVLALLVAAAPAAPRVEITVSSAAQKEPVTGRVFFVLTRDGGREPRLQAGS